MCKDVIPAPRGLPLKKRFNLFFFVQSQTLVSNMSRSKLDDIIMHIRYRIRLICDDKMRIERVEG